MRELTIATATRHNTLRWTNTHTDKKDLTARAYDPVVVEATTADYHTADKQTRDKLKDVGGFVGGHLKDGRRRKGHVVSRSLITLDIDNLPEGVDLLAHLEATCEHAWLAHTTLSHTPQNPRWRMWVWLTRNMTPDEYEAVARRIAQDLNPGLGWFDPSTFQPERFMYWPAVLEDNDNYTVGTAQGKPDLNPDDVLARYETWTDLTTWPGITAHDAQAKEATGKVDDPRNKPGMLGAFNRTYTIDQAIKTFLPAVYTPGVKGRYTYTQGTSANGLIVYNGGYLCYSQHATDPAADGHTHSAFDLVRIHRFGHLDTTTGAGTPANKRPSYVAMMDLANEDGGTRAENARETALAIAETFTPITPHGGTESPSGDALAVENGAEGDGGEKEKEDPTAWLETLTTHKNGDYEKTINNFETIFLNDPRFTHIAYNSHANHLEVQDPQALPWDQIKPGWTDNDDAMLKATIARDYKGLYAPNPMHDALLAAATQRAFHPVRDYFNHLPPWDGVERLDTLLVDTLGAEDSPYTRAVTRKTLVAAHRRTFQPGAKFDYVLTLVGPQGIGKSTIFAKLAGQWFSDSLTITDMKDKTGAEKLLGNLIVELSELAGMRKTEAEPIKGFISRTEDKYRPAYGRTVETYPRQCIIVGSTNAEDGFLRDPTGGRRWWAVKVTGTGVTRVADLDQPTIDQIWAEARYRDHEGEKLYLEGDIADTAAKIQADSIEADDRTGMVAEFLDTPVPANWEAIPLEARRAYLRGETIGEAHIEPGMWIDAQPRETISKVEIWSECFGRDPHDMEKRHSHDISSIMQQIDNWHDSKQSKRLPIYGKQRIYRRLNPAETNAKKWGIDPDDARPTKG